ncbi:hypothetical protein [Nocardia sp. XZ_19_369]|uniref:hypothetical protein n=1 Tax=Nocardia sp. XZ_19_369 TaxID=2769487 RepID=UPI001890A149|nr:hypothetical protein [Nocardia sp. XZ_19_369]
MHRRPDACLTTTSALGTPASPDPTLAVVNCISAPADFAPWISASFADTRATLTGTRARGFYLRRLAGDYRHCLFASITLWVSIADFESWRLSPAFIAAHPDREQYSTEFAQMSSLRFDIDLDPDSATTLDVLDEQIVARLRTRRPDLIAASDVFVGELEWMPHSATPRLDARTRSNDSTIASAPAGEKR